MSFLAWQGASTGLTGWYVVLNRPRWAVAMGAFAPAWTVVYGLMGIAAWTAWKERSASAAVGLWVFAVQLILSGLWSWLFFSWHMLFQAALVAGVQVLLLLLTIILFLRVRTQAGLLLLPCLVWTLYVGALSGEIWRANPGAPAQSSGQTVINVSPTSE